DKKEAAIQLLEDSLSTDSHNEEVRVLLAQLIFDRDLERAYKLVRDLEESHSGWDYVEAIRTLHRLNNEYNDFKKNVNGDENSVWKKYVQGIEGLKDGDLEKALQSWIDVLPRDRSLDDDGARKACAALFKLLGSHHELTRKYHREFTSSLF
ncbi:tetratricopeptide repeat protein, partial [candidate division KSB1 bacterium]|nr:tetratricopeptide repeat protein [candidate division KSB1 bacterium]